jgi:DNA-directed RNA polymerase specialized sigma24 family protein
MIDSSQSYRQECVLVQQCLLGQSEAWDRLYSLCHDSLCAAIRHFLTTPDEDLVDELAACVWYALVREDCRLMRKFSESRCVRFTTYLNAIACNVARDYLKSAGRRRHREVQHLVATRSCNRLDGDDTKIEIEDFVNGLTREEERYLRWSTSNSATHGYFTGIPHRDYRLKHRLKEKLRKFYL